MRQILERTRRIEILFIIVSLIFGLLVWIIDALLDSLIFYDGSFGNLLILNVPDHEIYTRLIILACFLGFGILASRLLATRFRTSRDLSETEAALKTSEETTRALLNAPPDTSMLVDIDGNILALNEAAAKTLQSQQDRLIGTCVYNYFPADLAESRKSYVDGVFKSGKPVRFEDERSGILYDNTVYPIFDSEGNVKKAAVFAADITDRKKAEKILKRTQFSVNHSIDSVYWMGLDAGFVDVNETACKTLGYSRDELLDMTIHNIDPNLPSESWPVYWDELRNKGSIVIESNHRAKDGRIFPVEIAINHLRIDGDEYICSFARDITERKKAEEALKESEEKFRNLAERSPNMIFINCRGKIVFVNDKCEEIMGYTKEEFYAPDFDFLKLIAPEYIPLIKENLGRHSKNEEIQPYEYEIVAKNGERINSIISTKLIKYEGTESILGIVTDITEHKKAEKALQKSENDLVKAQRIAGVGSWEWDVTGKKISWSEEMYRIYGLEKDTELTLELIRGLIYPEDLALFENAVNEFTNNVAPNSFEFRILRPGGDIAYVQSTAQAQYNGKGVPVSLIGTVQDITERKKAEELREKLIADLQKAANEIKTLTGFIPICASCKKIRDDKGYWEQIETYIMEHSDAEFSHGLCPDCSKKLYPNL